MVPPTPKRDSSFIIKKKLHSKTCLLKLNVLFGADIFFKAINYAILRFIIGTSKSDDKNYQFGIRYGIHLVHAAQDVITLMLFNCISSNRTKS